MRRVSAFLVFAVLAALVAAHAASPQSGTLSVSQRRVSWTGGPLTGVGLAGGPDPTSSGRLAPCAPVWCDEFALNVDIAPTFWDRSSGVAVRIQWEESQDDLDLYVYDAAGNEVAHSFQVAGMFEEAFLLAPARGAYVVRAVGFDGVAVDYEGVALISSSRAGSIRSLTNTMQFTPPTIVDPHVSAAEPGVLAAPDGTIYATAPTALESLASHLWRSRNGGRTFELLDSRVAESFSDPRLGPCTAALGGADADLIVDRKGRLYFADLESLNVNVATSIDGGDSWTCNALSATRPLDDRPWLAAAPTADGPGPNIDAYLAYTDSGLVSTQPLAKKVKPFEIHLEATDNGGSTWKPRSTYAGSRIHSIGRMFVAPDGTIYHAFTGSNAVWVARSRDQGATFEILKVSQRLGLPASIFVTGDTDAAGNVFIAWVDNGTYDVLYSSSRDRGAHWSSPVRLNPPSSETAVMPWVAAGRAGDVAIAWYGTEARVSPETAAPATRWNAWVARSLNATARKPAFQTALLSETSMHFGPVCLGGQGCSDPNTRKLADFFQIDIAPDGAIVAAFNDNGRLQDTPAQPYVLFARQLSGLGLPGHKATVAGTFERPGDAYFPPHSTEGRNVPALDFKAGPEASLHGDTLRLSFPLSSARDLGSGLAAANAGVATAATWLVTWKANDRVEYAAMTMDASGTTTFFGGDQPGSPLDPRAYPRLTYPQQFPLNGTVDADRGTVTIEAPLERLHLKPGDILHGLQAFSMSGVPEAADFVSPQVADATPPLTLRLGAVSSPARSLDRGGTTTTRGRSLPATGVGGSGLAIPLLSASSALAFWFRRISRPRRRPLTSQRVGN